MLDHLFHCVEATKANSKILGEAASLTRRFESCVRQNYYLATNGTIVIRNGRTLVLIVNRCQDFWEERNVAGSRAEALVANTTNCFVDYRWADFSIVAACWLNVFTSSWTISRIKSLKVYVGFQPRTFFAFDESPISRSTSAGL